MSDANKFDYGKLKHHLLDKEAIDELVRVLMMGADKYGDYNWTGGMDWTRCYDAAKRHMESWLFGEDIDPESGLNHLAHAMCNMMFLLAYQKHGLGSDDRPTYARCENNEKFLESTFSNVTNAQLIRLALFDDDDLTNRAATMELERRGFTDMQVNGYYADIMAYIEDAYADASPATVE